MKETIFKVFTVTALILFLGGAAFSLRAEESKWDYKASIQQTLNIKTHEDVRDIRYNSFRTTIRGELMYEVMDTPDRTLRFYGLANYYYDNVLNLESPMRHSVRNEAGGRHKYRDVERPRDSEEWLKEIYVDYKYKDFRIKLGKQLVSWGETAESQVADLINPLDLKYIIAFPDWEDYKLGLWMARMFYSPKGWWQDMSFELIVIPFHFLEQRLPPAGHGAFVGNPTNAPFNTVFTRYRKDLPPTNLKNLEIGLRIKGYAFIGEGVDWYLSHFYTRSDTPITDGADGYNNFLRAVLGFPVKGKVFRYPFYNSTAFAFATTWDKIGSTIRGECTYNTNRDYHYGPAGPVAPKVKEKDLITTALTFERRTMIPWISVKNRYEPFSLTFTWYQYYMFNHKYNKSTGEFINGETGKDSSRTKFTFQASTTFLRSTIITLFNMSYDTNGNSVVMGALGYAPNFHWTFQALYQQINEAGISRYGNQVVLSAKYDFW